MSFEREAIERSANNEATASDGGVDPFAIVAGLIVAILISSFLLWLNGREEINGGGYGSTPGVVSTVAVTK